MAEPVANRVAPVNTTVSATAVRGLIPLWLAQQREVAAFAGQSKRQITPAEAARQLAYGVPLIDFALQQAREGVSVDGLADLLKAAGNLVYTLARQESTYRGNPGARHAALLAETSRQLDAGHISSTEAAARVNTVEVPQLTGESGATAASDGLAGLLFPVFGSENDRERLRPEVRLLTVNVSPDADANKAELTREVRRLRDELRDTTARASSRAERRWLQVTERDVDRALTTLDREGLEAGARALTVARDTATRRLLNPTLRDRFVVRFDAKSQRDLRIHGADAIVGGFAELRMLETTNQLGDLGLQRTVPWNMGLAQQVEMSARQLLTEPGDETRAATQLRQAAAMVADYDRTKGERRDTVVAVDEAVAQLLSSESAQRAQAVAAIAQTPVVLDSRFGGYPPPLAGFDASWADPYDRDYHGPFDVEAHDVVRLSPYEEEWAAFQRRATDATISQQARAEFDELIADFDAFRNPDDPSGFASYAQSVESIGRFLIPRLDEVSAVLVDLGGGYLPSVAVRQWTMRHAAATGRPEIPIVGIHAGRRAGATEKDLWLDTAVQVLRNEEIVGPSPVVVTDYVVSGRSVGRILDGAALAGAQEAKVVAIGARFGPEKIIEHYGQLAAYPLPIEVVVGAANNNVRSLSEERHIPGWQRVRSDDPDVRSAHAWLAVALQRTGAAIWNTVNGEIGNGEHPVLLPPGGPQERLMKVGRASSGNGCTASGGTRIHS